MPNFWEENAGPNFHGHLKLGEAQKAGYDVHGTFPRDGKLPHISVYEVSSNGGKVERNLYLRVVKGTVGLSDRDRQRLLDFSGVSQELADNFIVAVWKKHLALNQASVQSAQPAVASFNASDFPALGARSSPPLLASQPVAEIPQRRDRIDTLLADLPDNVRQVALGSGAFD